MEWYYWLLIGYGALIFISTLIGYYSDIRRKRLIDIFPIMLLFVMGLVFTPFLWLVAWFEFISFSTPQYKTFTIHELTEENKITLREIGFNEGEFVSKNNIDYKGFRYGGGSIGIQYNGRVFIKYLFSMSKEQKHIMEQIKRLPKPIDVEAKVEGLKNQIKDKKESQKNWVKWYQEDVDKLQKQIDELKQTKENK